MPLTRQREEPATRPLRPLGERRGAPALPRLAGPGTVLFLFLGATVALVPLPLGSVEPAAWGVLALVVAGALLWSAAIPLPWPADAAKDIAVPAALLAVVVGWAVLQTLSFTPSGWHAPIWREAGEALGRSLPGSIAADRHAPPAALTRLLGAIGVFYLAWRLGGEARRAQWAVALVAAAGSAYAVYGLIAFWAGNTRVLWLPKTYYPHDLTGTFLNRDHFATYLGLTLLAVVARALGRFEGLRLFGGWRTRAAQLGEFVGGNVWHLVALFAVATALLSTHSRGGFIAAAAGLLALGGSRALASGARRRRVAAWLAVLALLALLGVAISGGPTLDRLLGTDIAAEERLTVWKLVLGAIADHPFAGTGLGSFPEVFPAYRTAAVLNVYTRAHNDYLESMLELGIPVALCLFAALAWLAGRCLIGVRTRRRDTVFPSVGLAASVLVGVQSLADFSLQVPAVATVYAFLLGVGVAQSRSTRTAPR